MRSGPPASPTRAAWRQLAWRRSGAGRWPGPLVSSLRQGQGAGGAVEPKDRGAQPTTPALAGDFDVAGAFSSVEAWIQPLLPGMAVRGGSPGEALIGRVQQLVERTLTLDSQIDALFALSPDGLVLFDAQGRVLRVNPAFSHLTGLSAEMLVGLEESVFLFRLQARCEGGDLSAGLSALGARPGGAAVDGFAGAPVGERATARQTLSLRRPREATVQVGLFDAGATGRYRLLQLRDITAAAQVDQMKSEFLAAAAHELRTPMTSICGFIELLLMREMPAARQRDLLERVHRQSGIMVGVVDDLLDLARIEAGQGMDFDFEDVDLGKAVSLWVGDVAVPDGRDRVRVVVSDGSVADGLLLARVDCRKLQQALGNLIGNAYRYSPGGGEVVVEIGHRLDDEGARWVALAVRDHGIGLAPAALQRVGERFFRADQSGRTPGTGLGVSIVRQIVECHAGRMTVDSVENEGSCFTLLLPTLDRARPLPVGR